jgi:hypothetical protein
MNDVTRTILLLTIVRPIAGIVGFGIGYGLGKVVSTAWNKIDDYYYYRKRFK